MARSGYIADIRSQVGSRRLLVPSVSVVIADADRRILLLRHNDGDRWGTPGGAMEPGECPADAAAREAWEETGLHVVPTQVIGVFGGPGHELTYDNGDVTAYVSTVFAAHVVAGTLRLEREEVAEARWVDKREVATLPTAALAGDVLDAAFAHVNAPDLPTYFAPPRWSPPSSGAEPDPDTH